MGTDARTASVEHQQRTRLLEVSWQEITEPGAYVEVGTGDLYRIPKEALIQGSSPMVRKESLGASSFMRVSKDPFVTTYEARMLCAENNIHPNF